MSMYEKLGCKTIGLACAECGSQDAAKYGPMLRDVLWKQISEDPRQFLCSDCVERRVERLLGRALEYRDLKPCQLSSWWWDHHRGPSGG